MKKVLAIIGIITMLSLFLGLPVAASGSNGNPPVEVTVPPPGMIVLDNENIGGVNVSVFGFGIYKSHINKPASNRALEESWFEVTSFTGYISLNGVPMPVSASDVKVIIHAGALSKANQPIITIHSSVPINLYGLFGVGFFTDIQMVGWGNIVHVK